LIHAPSPVMRLLGDTELWVTSSRSFYHVHPVETSRGHLKLKPELVSVTDAQDGIDLMPRGGVTHLGTLPYRHNSLSFRFFAGSYGYDNLSYRVDMEGPFSNWSISRSGSNITLPNMKEGRYQMRVSLVDSDFPLGEPLLVSFTIRPPWYRSIAAYMLYALGLLLLAILLSIVPVALVRNRNRMLARLVDERTHELALTMDRLREEERTRAVHEERSRIAHEIHDSVQQGLSGLKLILDSTLKHSDLPEDLQRRLVRAKTILTFTHQEVKHAVWDMETPLLKDGNLCVALERLAALVNCNSTRIEVVSEGEPISLPATTNHHLLRIVQESITNAIRHGEAHHIRIMVKFLVDHALVSIRDDGKGFDVQQVTGSSNQLGLRGVLDRVERFKGSVQIFSQPGEGTEVKIRVPAEPNPQNEDEG
jgi:signal transduction histidine kinase